MERANDTQAQPGMPQLALIVAMTKDHVIGSDAGIPWQLPADLKLFKSLTMGCTVIMGRKTYKSIGHPLTGRQNIVLSRSHEGFPSVQVYSTFMSGLTAAAQLGRPVFVIGGEEIYRKALPLVSELHISWIKEAYTGNRFFPPLDFSEWRVCTEERYTDFRYIRYLRRTFE